MNLSVIIITKNESDKIARAIESVRFATEIIVLDSGSTDDTREIAIRMGAIVYTNADWQGYGIQKQRALALVTQPWVLSLDADEWVSDVLANNIQQIITNGSEQYSSGFLIRRSSIFIDRTMRFGDWSGDLVLRLFRRSKGYFSDDPVHERLIVEGPVQRLGGVLWHWPVTRTQDSTRKMWRYNLIAAKRLAAKRQVTLSEPWTHATWSLVRGMVLRLGLLDGLRGMQLAWYNAKGVFIRYEAARRQQHPVASVHGWKRLKSYLQLWLLDHGILRNLYDNQFELPGLFFRANQPSPSKIDLYKRKYRLATIINLRGPNPQLGWYRLEREACDKRSITLINTQVFSRGLPTRERIHELKNIIETMALPAMVHCKSGADRAGFFAVLYRHFYLGEPIETARRELHWKYGHFRSAKTGILDYFFERYLTDRRPGQQFIEWVDQDYDRDALEKTFRPKHWANFLVDTILQRE